LIRIIYEIRYQVVYFSKIEFFNLTQYDKVIGLDNDVFLRQNIAQWFDYPAPAATQARGTIEWNSGAMVIEPNEEIYNTLLKYIPKFGIANKMKELMASILVTATKVFSRHTEHTIHTMSYGASVLSSDLKRVRNNDYFWKYRNKAIETVHFTTEKPWKGKTGPRHPILCRLMKDWLESVSSAPKNELPELPHVLRNCKPEHIADPAPSNEEIERVERKK
jgi:alpha-N-acetylglucosamine transferase